jgi:hypothetical protein
MKTKKILSVVQLDKIRTNIMGTCSFNLKFDSMRKIQDFIVYPIDKSNVSKIIQIQSDTRIGQLDLDTGKCIMTKSHPNGAYGYHLALGETVPVQFNETQCNELKVYIYKTKDNTGTNGIMLIDNTGAKNILG